MHGRVTYQRERVFGQVLVRRNVPMIRTSSTFLPQRVDVLRSSIVSRFILKKQRKREEKSQKTRIHINFLLLNSCDMDRVVYDYIVYSFLTVF